MQTSFAVTAKLISAFVFATRTVQFIFYLNPKFQSSRSFLLLCRPVCVRPIRKPHCWFSHETAHLSCKITSNIQEITFIFSGSNFIPINFVALYFKLDQLDFYEVLQAIHMLTKGTRENYLASHFPFGSGT